jgi:sec-independent protein translocase protein TatA
MQFPFAFLPGGMPGVPELLIIAVIALLLFGNRLPGAMRSLGRSVVEFKKGVSGIEEDVNKAMDDADKKASAKTESTEESTS